MNVPLDSRVFSTETLVAGVAMAEAGLGMDQLNDVSCEELQEQLAQLEDSVWGGVVAGLVQVPFINKYMV